MRVKAAFLFALTLGAGCSSPLRNNFGDASVGDLAGELPDLHKVDLLACPPCSGNTPVCDPKTLQCVGCLVDGDCGAGELCVAGACHAGCSKDHPGCASDGGACDVDLGICRGCLTDKECGGKTPRCDAMSGHCVPCVSMNDNCGPGTYCSANFTCDPGCKTDFDCPVPDGGVKALSCCNNACVDTTNDGANCGACGTKCNGTTCCKGVCSDEQTDPNNCGACGMKCSYPNAMAGCVMGGCTLGMCTQGFGDCDGQLGNGCESFLGGDLANCGKCGNKCGNVPNGTAACVVGMCTIASCTNGFTDCDKQYNDGCESNTASDINNCGFCGVVCNGGGPHTTGAACVNGMCALACVNGYADCDKMSNDGCEAVVQNDINNCGGCGVPCTKGANVASVTCTNAMCGIGSCNPGFNDCDMQYADGCEANFTNDPNNCGGCGMKCPLNANVATDKCTNSACGVATCNAGFADCDGNFANGCEINTTTDSNHCGNCQTVCANNGQCANGLCPGNGKVLIAAAELPATMTALQTKLVATNAFVAVDVFNLQTGTPTVAQLQQYAVVLSWTDYTPMDEITFMNNLATYYDGGGRVVLAVFKVGGYPAGYKGTFDNPNNGYMLFTLPNGSSNYSSYGNLTLGVVNEPGTPLMLNVVNPTTTGYLSNCPLANGAVVVANWSDGKPFIVRGVAKGRKRADLNLWPDPAQWGGDSINAIRNALQYQ
jgi:hypothetical protein